MCLVEEKKSLKPLASCSISISGGMVLFTKTSLVKKAREGVIEYLLINHPLDCPICDQGGECDLQDQTMVFGSDRGRFYEYKKRSVENKNLSSLIKTSLNRCIQCARCTRFLESYGDKSSLIALLGRGSQTEISSYLIQFLKSEISGNIIDLCPVGALTSKIYAFKARSWELFFSYSTDIFDSLGSNIRIDYRGTEIMRIIPKLNESVNSEWITDGIRFFYDCFNLQRLLTPKLIIFQRSKPSLIFNLSYNSIFLLIKKYIYLSVVKRFSNHSVSKFDTNLFFIGNFLDIQDLALWKFLINKIGSNLSFTFKLNSKINDYRKSYLFSNSVFKQDLSKKTLICISSNPRFESPILNMKLKDNFSNRVGILGFISNINYSFFHIGTKLSLSLKNIWNKNFLFVINYYNASLLNYFDYLLKSKLILNYELLNVYLSDIGLHETNISSKRNLKFNFLTLANKEDCSVGINYFLASDDNNRLNLISKYKLLIYQGSHGSYLSSLSDIVIPSQVFIDRPLTFLNLFGSVQSSTDSTFFKFSNKNLISDWLIAKNLLGAFFQTSKVFLNSVLEDRLLGLFGIKSFTSDLFIKTNYFLPNQNWWFFNKKILLSNTILKSLINNLYSSNLFFRLSHNLTIHNRKFLTKNDYVFALSDLKFNY